MKSITNYYTKQKNLYYHQHKIKSLQKIQAQQKQNKKIKQNNNSSVD